MSSTTARILVVGVWATNCMANLGIVPYRVVQPVRFLIGYWVVYSCTMTSIDNPMNCHKDIDIAPDKIMGKGCHL